MVELWPRGIRGHVGHDQAQKVRPLLLCLHCVFCADLAMTVQNWNEFWKLPDSSVNMGMPEGPRTGGTPCRCTAWGRALHSTLQAPTAPMQPAAVTHIARATAVLGLHGPPTLCGTNACPSGGGAVPPRYLPAPPSVPSARLVA